jgi:hypothetical protein
MARRTVATRRSRRSGSQADRPIDVADLGRQMSAYETNNGLAHGIVGTAVVLLAVVILRPLARALRAFLRG